METDNTAITYMQSMKNKNSRLMRWCWKLQEFVPTIIHIKDRDKVVADFLSRNPISDQPITATISSLTLTCDISKTVLKSEQQKDEKCKSLLLSSPDKFCLLQDIIYKKISPKRIVPVIPDGLRAKVLEALHDSPSSGYMGVDKTYQRLKCRAFFQGMRKFVEEYVKTCGPCQQNKYTNQQPTGLMSVKPITRPWHTLYVDLLGPYTPSTSSQYSYVLVIVDGFSKSVLLHPLREATAKSVRTILERDIYCRFRQPHTLVSDNATIFHSATMRTINAKWGINHSFTSPYHPQTNLAERVNRVVKPMLWIYLEGKTHNKWSESLPLLQLAINSAKHDSTGLPPFQILFNSESRLPIDNFIQYDGSDAEDNADEIAARQDLFNEMLTNVKSSLEHV